MYSVLVRMVAITCIGDWSMASTRELCLGVASRHPANLFPFGRFGFGVNQFQDTAGTRPCMGEGVDDEKVVAEFFRLPDAAYVLVDGEGGLDHVHVVVTQVGIQ